METTLVDSLFRRISVNSINIYQKRISPHKGFSCAHRLLYGGESCSQYIKNVINKDGLTVGLRKSRQRFAACKQANQILRMQHNQHDQSSDRIKKSRTCRMDNTDCNSAADCTNAGCDCTTLSCDLANNIGDCHSLDCSGMDCSFLDCGGCGS